MKMAVIDKLLAIDHAHEPAVVARDTHRSLDPPQVCQGLDGADHDRCEPRQPVIRQEHCKNELRAVFKRDLPRRLTNACPSSRAVYLRCRPRP